MKGNKIKKNRLATYIIVSLAVIAFLLIALPYLKDYSYSKKVEGIKTIEKELIRVVYSQEADVSYLEEGEKLVYDYMSCRGEDVKPSSDLCESLIYENSMVLESDDEENIDKVPWKYYTVIVGLRDATNTEEAYDLFLKKIKITDSVSKEINGIKLTHFSIDYTNSLDQNREYHVIIFMKDNVVIKIEVSDLMDSSGADAIENEIVEVLAS